QFITDRLQGAQLLGNDPGIDVGNLALASGKQTLPIEGPDPTRLLRLKDHPEGEPVGHIADDHPAERQYPPDWEVVDDCHNRHTNRKAEQETDIDNEAKFPTHSFKDAPVRQLGLLLDTADHHQLDDK